MHIDPCTDALAVFHEGRETADLLLVGAPKQVGFHCNQVLRQAGSGESRPNCISSSNRQANMQERCP